MHAFRFAALFPALLVFAFFATAPAHGATFKTIYTFTGQPHSCYPSELTLDKNGTLYGAASGGGEFGAGAVFELTPSPTGWVETILYSFQGAADGANPAAGLIIDADGNLYGTTGGGGLGYGTVFELTPGLDGWTKTTLYTFKGPFTDGFDPTEGKLTFDQQGNLYGSTYFGGVNNDSVCYAGSFVGCGTVFELSPAGGGWTESSLFSFNAKTDGWFPSTSPMVRTGGKLYVTARQGDCCKGGTLLQLTPSPGGWTEKVFRFNNNTGKGPIGDLLLHDQGAYGVTQGAGPNGGGTVYRVDRKKNLTVLYSFTWNGSDGFDPQAGLTLLSNKLYGTTVYGGSNDNGTIYDLVPSAGQWTEEVLYSFPAGSGQVYPSGLIADGNGNLYGAARGGGALTCGTAFEVTP